MPLIPFIVLSLAIALTGGLLSAVGMLAGGYPFGRIEMRSWHAWPHVGARQTDPYTRAILARTGEVPLGTGEGLSFIAEEDDQGRVLHARCTYLLEGTVPAARAWTLTVYDRFGDLPDNPSRRNGLTSSEVVREAEGRVKITLSTGVASGNWIPLPERGALTFILRLYDSPLLGASKALAPDLLPAIRRGECR